MNQAFIEMSVTLTGLSRVELLGTDMADLYWAKVISEHGQNTADELLNAWQTALDSSDPLETAIRTHILAQPALGGIARNIIKMWYLGQWADQSIVSAEAYREGLVWEVIGAHTQGAKQQGFGAWSLPPKATGKGVSS